MRHVRSTGWLIAGLTLGAALGCTRNYYYYNDPAGICAPTAPPLVGSAPVPRGTVVSRSSPIVVDNGAYCTVPAPGQGTTTATKPERSNTVVVNGAPPARVVTNDPNYQGYTANRGWRNRKDYGSRDYGTAGTTQISGAINDDDLTR
jgi:hypothetical protein